MEALIVRSGLAASRAARASLLALELEGRIRQLPGQAVRPGRSSLEAACWPRIALARRRGIAHQGQDDPEVSGRRRIIVKASMGHVRDLPKSQLGVNAKKGFKPRVRGARPARRRSSTS